MTKLNALTLALALVAAPLSTAHAASAADFVLVNNTGYTIKAIRFKTHNTLYWGNDALFKTVLYQGDSTLIEFYKPTSCNTDIQIEYLDGSTHNYLQGQDLCKTRGIRFFFGVSSAW